MKEDTKIKIFLGNYDKEIIQLVMKTRQLISSSLPGINEEVDLPARMIAYTYGPRYADTICTVIPSKKGVKLGFYKGPDLPDPDKILQGTGKISRYVQLKSVDQINSPAVKLLLINSLVAYELRKKEPKN